MKTFKEIDIKYYDNSGNVQVRCTVPVTQEASVHYELMQSHYCKLSFNLSRPTYFLRGDFIETPYGRFELIDLTKAKDNDTIGYSYEIQFDAYYRKLKNKILKYRPNTGSQEATFSLTSKISTHIEVIMKNLAYYAKLDKSYLYDPNFEGEGTDYTYVIDASVDANAAKLITYSNTSILDAIANIAQTFGCEWWFEGNILHFGTCENTNAITDFRLNDNIVSMSSSQSQSTYANRVYAFGAARNLPSGYKNDSDADITKDGVVEKRLMLPTSAECSEQNKQMLAENGFELNNGYIQVGGLHEDQYVEGVTTNDDIYPRNLIKTSKVTSYEKDVEDESTPEEGDYIKRTFYRVNSLAIVNEDGEKTGDMAFRKAYILSGKNLHIVFQSGSLSGMNFECEFNPDGVSEILKDDDGNPILKDGKEQINPKSQVFEIVANEDYGRFLPDITLHPKDGDTFVLYNWDSTKLGDTLVSSASNELLTDAIKDLKKSMIDPTTYTCTAEANYSYNQGRGNLHGVGDRVNLYNKGYGDSYRASRIIGYEFCLDIPYDGAKYYVGEKPSYSRLNAMESKIEELVYNGQSYLNGNGGSGRSIYIIKSYDSITPTDYNVFSAKAVDEQRLNKTKDDTAKGTITWEKVQKLLSGLLVGNFNNENGGSWTPDTEGRSHLITDYLEVRMKAIFEELVIKKTSTIGGKEIISPAGGVVAHKVEEVTVTYNNVSQKAYRCYFLAEQEGDSVDNDFAIGDQVRSESFNVRKGTYHKVGNHFYWRLVIGRDEEPVELEGKKYHYIDLSDTDCATASDVPAKGDVLNQCGNRTDVERQNCLIFSAVDTYSPSISLYHGINSYSFANKEYVEYGVNKQNNKAFFHVYGDMYVGDRPTKENGYEGSSYIKYDSAAKQVSVKGKISAKSTVDGKELSQYIKENSAKGLTEEQVNNLIKNSQVIADLQNQVDGAIETWFYEGVPTLKNAPASSWTTDKDKDTHLGDLYYDNKTGKAYRFAKDGNTYKWNIITDTDIAKALSDASKAQETADGKMKVFSTQPIPPYQLGDIWVNATYPTDGSIYKNEILRCQTAKANGSSFAIADWTKASKYTDDSALNTFKEEYKNDMASYKEQLDEKVETWFYNYAPTTQNKPASDWTTDTLKSQHAGDLFYNTSNGYTYRWTGTAWARIKDNDINTAMTAASKAQDTADGKRTVFTSQPTVPYDEGDLWASGGDDGKTLMVCVKSRATGSFTSSEWVKANDSDLNAFAKTIEESLTGIRDQLDKKAETWYQATDPSASWTTDDAKKEHKGDLWYNTSNNQTFFWNGTKWDKQDVPTEVFDKIDGKSSIYVSKPASYEERDLWILEAAYTLGGVAYSKGELVVATKTNASFSAADWTKKVKYTDDTVANAAKKAAEEAKKAADTAQTNVTNLGKTVTSNKKAFDNYVTDGYLEPSEIAAMAQDSKRLEDAFAAAEKSYNEVKGAEVLKSTKELTDLNTAFTTLSTAKKELITYLSDISTRYNAADTEGKANIVSAVGTKFTNFQSAYSAFYDKLGLANAYITSKIYGDLKQNITDLAGYKYLKDALGQTTDIDGGLVMTTLLALRDGDGNVQSGINGAIDPNRGKKSIATWWGGQMVDKDYNSGNLTPATSLIRFDGSGYLANGAIWWDVSGKVHADPTSFIISEKNLGAYLTFFEPTWKEGSAGTSVADLVSLKPNAPFSKLGVSGDATFEGAISFHGIKLTYDSKNKAIKIDGNLYTTGGITAYGAGASTTGGGGGLNGSVKSYSNALKLTSESLSEIASAYSIKALDSRISSLEGGSAMDVSVSGSGNAVTAISKSGTTIIVTKGTTFLTSHQSLASYLTKTDAASLYQPKGNYLTAHQSLDGYVNAIAVSGSGNAVTAVTKSGKTITFTKGATYLTSHQSLSNYYTKSSVDSLLSGKSATSHTHSVKINGITKTIAASGGDAVDLGTYLTTHQSLAAYATQNWVKNEATAHNADMVDNYHASGLFTDFSISDVANKVTISIGGTSKALNLVRAFPSGVGNNFNDIATHGNSMGMSNIAAPYASSTANYQTLNGYVNPNGQTGWHHYINLSYTDSNNTATSPNMCQTQFAIKAGTTEVYVRSRGGGKISNDAAWAAPWVRLARVTDNVASASKVANALSWSGYSSGSYNGSAAKSISIPNNTNQLTNGAGFITASASISGNAGSATKLQNARTINGTSFNGTANIVTSYWGTTRKLWGNSVNGNADVNGSITIANTDGVYVQIGDVRLVYDKANTAIKVVKSDGTTAANFYATGGITAYGEGSGSSGGGGLNGSVKSYADALKLASESLSEIASAYSIKQLSTRITSLEGGSATSISVSGGGNAVTSVTKNGTTISVVKGSTFLTSHQSLSAYLKTENANNTFLKLSGGTISNNLIVNGSIKTTKLYLPSIGEGYIVSGVKDTNGSDFASVNCILKNWNSLGISSYDDIIRIVFNSRDGDIYLRGELSAASLSGNLSWSYITDRPSSYTPSAHTHKWTEITDRITKVSQLTNDKGYLTSHQSLAAYLKSADAEKTYSKLGHTHAFSEITGKPTTLSGFGITDGLRSVTQPSGSNVFVTGISTSGTAITYTKSYTKKSLSAVGTSGWTNASIDGNIIPDMSFIACWNGAYSGTSSNLAYCNKGAFGSFAIKNSLAFSELTSKPTTISGYGITDAYTKSQVDTIAAKYLPLTGGTLTGQLKIEAGALNGAYNGLRIGDDCYIGDCNFGNTIGLMGVGNNNAGMVKFGKGGMQFGYNGLNHIASTTAQWTNLNADLLDGWHKNNIVWSGAVNSNTASLSHYWAKLFDITVTGNQYDDRNFTFLFSNGFNDTFSVVVLRIRQNGAKDSGAYKFIISLRELVGNMSSRLRVYYNNATGNVQLWGNCQRQYGSLSYTIIKKTGRASADFTSQGTLVTNTSFSAAQSLPATTGNSPYTLLDGATRIGIVKQADQLVTARKLWGNSFNGTADINGSIIVPSGKYISIGNIKMEYDATNKALKIDGNLYATGGVSAYSSSDIRLKQDLRKLDYLGIIKAMGGTYGFAWKKDNTRSIGWIAQHVLCNPHLKDIVETDENGYYKINYWSPKLIATAFGAIEQVGDEVSRLKARVVFLESEVQRLSGKQDGNNKKRLDNKNINLLN